MKMMNVCISVKATQRTASTLVVEFLTAVSPAGRGKGNKIRLVY